jgi:hypothetical protein
MEIVALGTLFICKTIPIGCRKKALGNHSYTISTPAPYFLGSQGESETGSILHTEPRHISELSTKSNCADLCSFGFWLALAALKRKYSA